jgi:MFS family permease
MRPLGASAGTASAMVLPMTRWLLVLVGLSTMLQGVDRQLLGVLIEPIKHELQLSDTAMGALAGSTFALFYVLASFPLARRADIGNRRSLVAACLGFWSLMTAVCGLATTGWQLAVARGGVALGEAGNIPACMSMVSDGRPKSQRGRGPSIIIACQGFGAAAGLAIGGFLAATVGWRMAFVILGIPGIVVALLMRFTTNEPGRIGTAHQGEQLTLLASLKSFMRLPTFWFMTACVTLTAVAAFGMGMWVPSFFARVHHMNIRDAGLALGLATGIAVIAGSLLSGFISDWLSRRDIRWCGWFAAVAATIAAGLVYAFATVQSANAALIICVCISLTSSQLFVPMWAAALMIARPRTQGMIAAWITTFVNGGGLGIGPLLFGALNDHFAGNHGDIGIKYSVMMFVGVFLLVAISALMMSMFLKRDQYIEQ